MCIDDPDTAPLVGRPGVITYGTEAEADFRIADIVIERHATSFDAFWRGAALGRLRVGLPGQHNALNAAGAAAIALSLGVDAELVAAGLDRLAESLAASSRGASIRESPSSTTMRTCQLRLKPRLALRLRGLGIGWLLPTSHTASAGPKTLGPHSRHPSEGLTSRSHRYLSVGRNAAPGCNRPHCL